MLVSPLLYIIANISTVAGKDAEKSCFRFAVETPTILEVRTSLVEIIPNRWPRDENGAKETRIGERNTWNSTMRE